MTPNHGYYYSCSTSSLEKNERGGRYLWSLKEHPTYRTLVYWSSAGAVKRSQGCRTHSRPLAGCCCYYALASVGRRTRHAAHMLSTNGALRPDRAYVRTILEYSYYPYVVRTRVVVTECAMTCCWPADSVDIQLTLTPIAIRRRDGIFVFGIRC